MNTPLQTPPTATGSDVIAEATLMGVPADKSVHETSECCLVQIYPADVVDGMHLIEKRSFTAGRDESCDLCLPHSSVSRKHAELVKTSDGYLIQDLGSTNGTLVNETQITKQPLRSGDTLQFGCYMFKFLHSGSVESQYHETVYSAMTQDVLTGTMNRRYLLETLKREVIRSRRQQQPLAVIMLDIDHFKQVNDSHGHLVGDEVLREFGRRIQSVCREDDLLARYGGEEFCICMFGPTKQQTLDAAERCRKVVAETLFATTAGELQISASFGVACFDYQTETSSDELLRVADKYLYEAKKAGRNCICG